MNLHKKLSAEMCDIEQQMFPSEKTLKECKKALLFIQGLGGGHVTEAKVWNGIKLLPTLRIQRVNEMVGMRLSHTIGTKKPL